MNGYIKMPRYKASTPLPPKKMHRAPSTQPHSFIAGGGHKQPKWCGAAKRARPLRRKVVSTGNNAYLKKKK